MSKVIPTGNTRRLTLRLIIVTLTSAFLVVSKAEVRESGVFPFIGSQPASAQFFRPQDVAQQVYQRLPDLPKENQYVSKETGKVNPNDTLMSRLIRYHLNVKSRPPNYRFDWKLTLSDYLGANELIAETQYPSGNTLQTNPMESDRALIQKLNRSQRDALVNVLVSIFSPNTTETSTPAPTPSASPPPPETPTRRATPSLPKPGDAQLLRP